VLSQVLSRSLCFVALAMPAAAQTVLFSDGFENGFASWSTTGLWHLEHAADSCGMQVAPFPEGQFCAYYGIDNVCNYDTGSAPNHGTLTLLAPIVLPLSAPAASLHCWTRHQTEPCDGGSEAFDLFNIELSIDGGANWTVVGKRCPAFSNSPWPPDQWEPRGIDLTPYRGQSILLRFRFDTIDNNGNFYRGAFVDKVEVRTEVGQPFCASSNLIVPNFCPCAGPYNMVTIGYGNMSGCTNSSRHDGELAGEGTPLVSSDTVVLKASELGAATVAILLQSDLNFAGALSGDGLLCLTGGITRLAVHESINGTVSFPGSVTRPCRSLGPFRPAAERNSIKSSIATRALTARARSST